jgi:periplasmic protein TonB
LLSITITNGPGKLVELPRWIKNPPLVFSNGGGGGGGHDSTPPSLGALPATSLIQLMPPTVHMATQTSRLMVEPTIVAPDISTSPSNQIGDPTSPLSKALSDGTGHGGIGRDRCCGVGDKDGSGAFDGPHRAGIGGVTNPVVIFNPEPVFSNEARESKTQGMVTLILVVDETGHTRDIRVQQSLGMGLDEKAIEAVTRWRFKPAMLGNTPVPVQIAVEVNFRLY